MQKSTVIIQTSVFAILFSLIPMSLWASETKLLNGFEYATDQMAQMAWQPQAGSPPVATMAHRTEHGQNALRLDTEFTETAERGYWDRDVRIDLSPFGRFTLWVLVENASAVRQGTLYFRSGEGWFGAWFSVVEGWQQIPLLKSRFAVEGNPTGWHQVDGIRLSFWGQGKGQATIAVDDLEGLTDEIVVVRGNRTQLAQSGEWRSVQRFADQMVSILDRIGIDFGVIEDTDVEAGSLTGCQLAIFPYNPHISEAEVEAIEQFVAAGGKIVLFYSLPEGLRSLLGLTGERWTQAAYEGQFASIRLDQTQADLLPRTVAQGSWNVRIPEFGAGETTVLGEWVDAEGKATGLPALTLHPNGVFMGHVLLPNDLGNKQRLMLALLHELLPELRSDLATSILDRMGNLGVFADFAEAEAFIESNLQLVMGNQRIEAKRYLRSAGKAMKRGKRAIQRGQFGRVFESAEAVHEQLRQAYYWSFPPRQKEFRAVWCHSAFGIPGWSWDEAVQTLAENGFNAIVPNMLWAGATYYPSDVLPVAEELADQGDQIEQCLTACRKHGLQIHVWKVNWNLSHAPEAFVDALRAQERLQQDRNGDEIAWLCPSHPENFELELESMLEIVRNYGVDGIHFDYIRYPHGNACYCDGCRTRFEQAADMAVENWPQDVIEGDQREVFGDWRRAQITRLVRAVSEQAREVREDIQISAAVFRDYPNCRETVGQDWKTWIDARYLDFVCPMDYTADDAQFQHWVERQLQLADGKIPLYPGIGASAPGLLPEQVAMQIHYARQLGTKGFIVFNYDLNVAQEHLPMLRLGLTRR